MAFMSAYNGSYRDRSFLCGLKSLYRRAFPYKALAEIHRYSHPLSMIQGFEALSIDKRPLLLFAII